MKHLFKEGKFEFKNGCYRLQLENNDAAAHDFYFKSRYDISSTLGMYDFEPIDGTDYYVVYKNRGKEGKLKLEDILTSINKLLSGDFSDLVSETTTLGMPSEEENDVFWDVNNNIIIVKGKENVRKLGIELHMFNFELYGIQRSKKIDEYYISQASDIPLLDKTDGVMILYLEKKDS